MSSRVLSYSEISTALACQARWDFKYGDSLAGSSLKEKAVAPLLSGGRAWGAAVAAWHANAETLHSAEAAIAAMDESLEADADHQREHGLHDQGEHDKLRMELLAILAHYVDITEPRRWDPIVEQELLVSIPSRSGSGRGSSRYKLVCFLDATETDDGGVWLIENKLRGSLSSVQLIAASRQIRYYAWAFWQATGTRPTGVITNERLRSAPKPPRVLASGALSHAKDQMCTPEAYLRACEEFGDTPVETTVAALKQRRWQQRVPVMFRDRELEEVGEELVAAAKLIQMLDSGNLLPIRNVTRANCGWCPYSDVCPTPDSSLVEALFERRPAKRDRQEEEQTA